MKDAQKAYRAHLNEGDVERVHIPETLEDSDSESDSFVQKPQKLNDDMDQGQNSSLKGEGETSRQVWLMNDINQAHVSLDESECTKANNMISPTCAIPTNMSTSPEVFITDDNIVNTQGSNASEVDGTINTMLDAGVESCQPLISQDQDEMRMIKSDKNIEIIAEETKQMLTQGVSFGDNTQAYKESDRKGNDDFVNASSEGLIPPLMDPSEAVITQEPMRRRSDRLKKETTMTTMEKNERMARKRNLEGNQWVSNSFTALPIDVFSSITADMGVDTCGNCLETFNLVKNLEQARDDIYQRQNESKAATQTESVESAQLNDSSSVEWLHEETSETDDFILVESRKKERENRKKLKVSPCSKGLWQDQENPGLPKIRGRKPKAPPSKNRKNKNK